MKVKVSLKVHLLHLIKSFKLIMFSVLKLLSLLIIGFIVLAILLASVIPVEIGIFSTTRGSLVTRVSFWYYSIFGCHSRCNIWNTFSS